ncbi:MAG TPA: hypothetical protein VGN17_17480 [Bryobacteraceae bacterium]|jgi:hypothetical protein
MLTIQITKRAHGAGVLRCTRADGSVTWQKQTDRHAAFFALHDLTHYAVETVLGFRQGFYGLLDTGWDIEDTGGKGARGRLPLEALAVARIVGLFDTERGTGVLITAEDYATFATEYMRPLSDVEIARVRARRGELFSQWTAVAPGDSLQLTFPASP